MGFLIPSQAISLITVNALILIHILSLKVNLICQGKRTIWTQKANGRIFMSCRLLVYPKQPWAEMGNGCRLDDGYEL